MPNVAFIKKELAALLPLYRLIRDALSGEQKVKEAKELYLPMPNAEDRSNENLARYKAYILRAVFFNATRRTLEGLLGQVFIRDPIIKVPQSLQPVVDDATGAGVTLIQESKRSLALTIAYSRSGLFVDFPDTSAKTKGEQEGLSVAELESGNIRPTLYSYPPQSIINWRVIESGARELLSLVVLHESFTFSDDGFEQKECSQIRVLRLDESLEYVQEIYRDSQNPKYHADKVPKGNFQLFTQVKPKGADGKPFKEIPFQFIGSENNNSDPDNPNMYDIASLNMAHYRNSADYEEACFICGQPTLVMSGLTQDWFDKNLKGKISFGSRGGIPLPVDADAKLLQAEENGMIKEAMETKERQLAALGAKLVEQKTVQRTATEAKQDNAAESSTLSSCVKNVSSAYMKALYWCGVFTGDTSGIQFELNSDFDIAKLTPEEQNAAVKNWQAKAITFIEMRNVLRRAGTATEDDTAAKASILADEVAALDLAAEYETEPGEGAE